MTSDRVNMFEENVPPNYIISLFVDIQMILIIERHVKEHTLQEDSVIWKIVKL